MPGLLRKELILKTKPENKFDKIKNLEHLELIKKMIYKSKENNTEKELDFEITYQLSLTVQERFKMMFEKSRILMEMLIKNGHRKPVEIIKRK